MRQYHDWFDTAIKAGFLNIDKGIKDGIILTPQGVFINRHLKDSVIAAFSNAGYREWEFPSRIAKSSLDLISSLMEKGKGTNFDERIHYIIKGDLETRISQAENPTEALRPSGESQVLPFWSENIQSYRDLYDLGKILLPQKVFRVPFGKHKTLTQFERVSIEGYSLHQTDEHSTSEMFRNIEILRSIIDRLSIPYVYVEAPVWDRNPFNDRILNLRVIADRGTGLLASSYNQGRNLSEPFGIKYRDSENEVCTPCISTFGVGLFYQLLATHLFEDGFIIPPEVSPTQVIIIPIVTGEENRCLLEYVRNIEQELSDKNIRVSIDKEYKQRLTKRREKYELSGVPIRVEIGKQELEQHNLAIYKRWVYEKGQLRKDIISRTELMEHILSSWIEYDAWSRAVTKQKENQNVQLTHSISDIAPLITQGKVAKFYYCGNRESIQRMYGERDNLTGEMISGLVGIGNFLGWNPEKETWEETCVACGTKPTKVAYWSRRVSI